MAAVLSSILPETFNGLPCCGGQLHGLQIKLKYVLPKGVTMSGFKLDVALEVTNPNSTGIDTTGITYKLTKKRNESSAEVTDGDDSEELVFAEGNFEDGISIPGGETTKVVVPVNCTYSGAGSAAESLWKGGKINFVMSGVTKYKIPLTDNGSYTLPYQVEGEFNLLGTSSSAGGD